MSTYSTNLALELIGTGQQAGAWGNTTNNNLGTLIEQAISGYTSQTITDGADTVLLMTNGGSCTARNMYIVMTGTLTAARNLVLPTNNKLYFVSNGTAGGYAVTVKCSGGTGVSIPAGAAATLVCNGTDIAIATNYLPSLALGAALPVTSGGTGVTTSTGSGANVLGTSPTIASPTLTGTPVAPTASAGTNTTQVATTAFVTSALQAAYPVGSIYMNASNSTTPATLLGFGSWSALGAGQMLLGAGTNSGNTFTAGSSGGNYAPQLLSHTHSATFTGTALPNHSHTIGGAGNGLAEGSNGGAWYNGSSSTSSVSAGTPSGSVSVANATSGDQTLGNLPPYLTVYMWQRTA